jgi:hypothetical protein
MFDHESDLPGRIGFDLAGVRNVQETRPGMTTSHFVAGFSFAAGSASKLKNSGSALSRNWRTLPSAITNCVLVGDTNGRNAGDECHHDQPRQTNRPAPLPLPAGVDDERLLGEYTIRR